MEAKHKGQNCTIPPSARKQPPPRIRPSPPSLPACNPKPAPPPPLSLPTPPHPGAQTVPAGASPASTLPAASPRSAAQLPRSRRSHAIRSRLVEHAPAALPESGRERQTAGPGGSAGARAQKTVDMASDVEQRCSATSAWSCITGASPRALARSHHDHALRRAERAPDRATPDLPAGKAPIPPLRKMDCARTPAVARPGRCPVPAPRLLCRG
jgi:hypothetical protein